jgi:hypothetical protein
MNLLTVAFCTVVTLGLDAATSYTVRAQGLRLKASGPSEGDEGDRRGSKGGS